MDPHGVLFTVYFKTQFCYEITSTRYIKLSKAIKAIIVTDCHMT